MAAKVTVKDLGLKKLSEWLKNQKDLKMTVGLHSEEAEGEAVAAAELNEFGSPGGMIPARPAITGWAAENEGVVLDAVHRNMQAALTARKDPIRALDQVAQKCAGEVQAEIAAGIDPPNAESTVKKKGSSTPLVNSGVFRSSIRGRVSPQ